MNNMKAYNLLLRIDEGYKPSAEENDGLASVRKLDLSNCRITRLPNAVEMLHNLQELVLVGAKFTDLPETLGQLSNLRVLNLSRTSITELPETVGELSNLQELVLFDADITNLPDVVGKLSNLQTLNLGFTKITKLPENVCLLANLQRLYLRGTGITELPKYISRLSNLKTLDLSRTNVTELPETVCRLFNLRELDLSNTSITKLPEEVDKLINLQEFNLSNTEITEIPGAVGRMPKLKLLDLCSLQLESLPESLLVGFLSFWDDNNYSEHNRRGIYIHKTTLKGIPTSALLQSHEVRIRQFGVGEKQTMNEAKIIFLGDGEVGKSYTIKRILNDGLPECNGNYTTSTTHGVRIEDYRPKGKELLIHLWDFGGQEIMYSMHRCFLTENTGYVVMVDIRKHGQTERARYWLQNVKSIAPRAPILLVLNLWDSQKAVGDLDDSKLIGEFGNDLKINILRCSAMYSDQKELQELMELIIETAQRVEKEMGSFAAEYIHIKNRLQKEYDEKPFIPVEKFAKICDEYNVHESADLLSWFNELGICFSYRDKDKKPLAGYKLLQPKWLTNAIYAIIMEGRDYAQKGKITRKAIYGFLKDPEREKENGEPQTRIEPNITYEKAECDYVIDVAKSFNLVYEFEGTLFFPSMLLNKTPKELVSYKVIPDMSYRLEYDFLPDTVIHQLMVECLKNSIKLDTCWLRGMRVTAIDDLSAIVKMVEDNTTLTIDVYGRGETKAQTMFKILRNLITQINDRLNMKCSDYIVASDGEKFTIERLQKEREKGHETVIGNNGKEYSLSKLIGIDLPQLQGQRDQELKHESASELTSTPTPNKTEKWSNFKDFTDGLNNIRWIIVPFIVGLVFLILNIINPNLANSAKDLFFDFFKNKGCGG